MIGKQFDLDQTSAHSGLPVFCALTFSGQVRNSLMKKEDEADAEKKKLHNRCQNLEAKTDLLLSAKVNSRKKFKTTNLRMDQNQSLNPESKSSLTLNQIKKDTQGKLEVELSHARIELEEMKQVYIQINTSIYIPKKRYRYCSSLVKWFPNR